MDHHIEGEHIYQDRIDFNGDAISLRGKGEMDFQSNVKMNFSTRVGQAELDLPVVRQIFRARQRTVPANICGRHPAKSRNPQGSLSRRQPGPATIAGQPPRIKSGQ